eukprot:c45415_g1_i1.p1 GENE.c45415_g1_i1~~c45415_g1_i1.p1  ORF type:complete len:437 (-),score=105.94 c45415_g1_i1:44-1354(-)
MSGFSLQDVIAKILTAPGPDQLKDLAKYLRSEHVALLVGQSLSSVPQALECLEPETHGFGILSILNLSLKVAQDQNTELPVQFIKLTERLLRGIPRDQALTDPNAFVRVCDGYAEYCLRNGLAMSSVIPLSLACSKIQHSPNQITSVHAFFLRACIVSKCYKAALPLLEQNLFEVSKASLNVENLLLYCYYAALVCIAVKRFHRAMNFLSMAFSVPEEATSAIVVAAYKRYVLVSLLLRGKVDETHRLLTANASRKVKIGCSAYTEFAAVFETRKEEDIKPILEKYSDVFQKDRLFGLVKQCMANLSELKIRRLTDAYLTLSLGDLASKVSLGAQDVEKRLFKMVSSGKITALIDQSESTVAFQQEFEQHNPHVTALRMRASMQRVQDLNLKLRTLHKETQLHKNYVQKASLSGPLERAKGGAPIEDKTMSDDEME